MSYKARIREDAMRLNPMDDAMFPSSNYESWNTFVNRFVEKE